MSPAADATPTPLPASPERLLVLTPSPTPLSRLLGDVWAARGLVRTLARKEFFVRYRRASFGILWAVGLPLLQAAVLVAVFSSVVRVRVPGDYPVFVVAGMVPWSFFVAAMASASTAIVDNAPLASKIYFPRAVLPLVVVGANLYGLAVTTAILVVLVVVRLHHLGVEVLLLLPATVLVVLLVAAFGLLDSVLHVYFRDLRFAIQAALLVWFYVTPIFYPRTLAHGALAGVVAANPMTGVVEMYRAACLGSLAGMPTGIAVTCLWIVALLVAAALAHRRWDRRVTDLL